MKKSFVIKKFVRLVCGGGLLGLISLSLVGVGFSSWLITSKDSPSRDTPLDSIGADGEFSDINQYLNIDSVNTNNLSWNNNGKTFNAANNEIVAAQPGYLFLFFNINTGTDLIKSHLPSNSSMKIVVDFSTKQGSTSDPVTALSNSIQSRKIIGSVSTLDSNANFDSGMDGVKKDKTWQSSFTFDESLFSGIDSSTKYYFGVRYKFVVTDTSSVSISSSTGRIAKVSRVL